MKLDFWWLKLCIRIGKNTWEDLLRHKIVCVYFGEWKVRGGIHKHNLTTLSLRFFSKLPFLKQGFTADLQKVSQHSTAHACMIRLELPWFRIPFFSGRCCARSFGPALKELWHLLMHEEGFSKRFLTEEKRKYALRSTNAGSLPRLWRIHIIGSFLDMNRSS